ncbi:MAG: hypothetical protein JST22_01135 [Bacteroidetes bacterium]|nr:hypothetical protein [Bacteroidota bacterium]
MNRLLPLRIMTAICLFCIGAAALQAQPAQWQPVGPGGGGALFMPSISPHNASEVYVACDMSELFHSTNGGKLWNQLDFRQFQSSGTIGRIEFTSDPAILYSLSILNDAAHPAKSTDGGATWHPLANDPTGNDAFNLIADPTSTTRLLLTDYTTLYVSTDGGASFAQRYQITDGSGCHMAGAFFDGNTIYLGTNAGLLVSPNNGASFSPAPVTGIPATEAIVSMAGAKQGNTTRLLCVTLGKSDVYAGITGADHGSYVGVYTLDIGSSVWVSHKGAIPAGVEPFFAGMARSNTGIAYVAGGSGSGNPTVYKTTDGGATWASVLNTSSSQNVRTGWSGRSGDRDWSYGEYALGFAVAPGDPNTAIISDLGFVHTTTSGGTTWDAAYVAEADLNPAGAPTPQGRPYHSIGIENTTAWQVFFAGPDRLIGCYSDIKGTISSDGGATWGFGYTGHSNNSMYRVTRRLNGTTLYAGTSSVHDMYQSTYLTDARIDGGKGQVLQSADSGRTWTVMHDFAHPVIWVATDPTKQDRLYASVINSSAGGIFVTDNASAGAGSQWRKVTNPPRTEGHPFNINVLRDGTLLVTYSGRRTTAFTESSGVFMSTDGGSTWTDRSAPEMHYWTKDLVVDPHDSTQNTWYVGVFSGWGGAPNGLGGLYRTTNRGQQWKKILDQDRVTSCTVDPNDANVMYATTETNGLWYSSNAASGTPTFTQVASYPFRQPERVYFNPYNTSEIWVSSFGNGLKRSASTTTQVPAAPVLKSPVNDSTGVPIDAVILSWLTVNGADTYDVQFSTDSTFATSLFETGTQGSLMSASSRTTIASSTRYYWHVRAHNAAGDGPWSATWHLTTAGGTPAPPTAAPALVSPSNHVSFQPYPVALTWTGVANATSYRIQLSGKADFSSTTFDTSNVAALSVMAPDTGSFMRYYWRVRGENAGGSGPWSTAWDLTTNGIDAVPLESGTHGITMEIGTNPMRASSQPELIVLALPRAADVVLRVVDTRGATVAPIAEGTMEAGTHSLQWNVDGMPSGVYYCVAVVGGVMLAKPVVIAR